jgi:hypothetical protein
MYCVCRQCCLVGSEQETRGKEKALTAGALAEEVNRNKKYVRF